MLPATITEGAVARPTCKSGRHDYAAYNQGHCRCAEGREAHRLYRKRRREGRQQPLLTSAVGTQRRLQGLLALGWPRPAIAAAAGLHDQARIRQLLNATEVRTVTAAAVREAARHLGGRPGPSEVVRRNARAAGYASLWAWDEDTIDDPAARPEGALRGHQRLTMPAMTPAILARFDQYAVPELGSPHVRWTGPTDRFGRGKLGFGPKRSRSTVSPRKIAYLRHAGRKPLGPVVPRCGNVWCVAGACMVDETTARVRHEIEQAAA